MEATIKITNGKKTKYVTKLVADDAAFMRRFGFWKDGDLKASPKQSAIPPVQSVEVDLLGMNTAETVVEEPKSNIGYIPIEETKAQVAEKLRAAGIKFNPNDKKEVLQSLLKEGK